VRIAKKKLRVIVVVNGTQYRPKGNEINKPFWARKNVYIRRRTGEKGMSRENVISRNPITKEQSIIISCGSRSVVLLLDEKKRKKQERGEMKTFDEIFTVPSGNPISY